LNSVFRSSGGGAVSFAVANNGVVVYAPEGRHELVWVTRDGRAEPIVSDRERFRFPSLSHDGKRIAVVVVSETRRSDIWIYDANSGGKTRLAEGIMPVWTPDGSGVAYNRDNLNLLASDGGAGIRVLIPGPTNWPTSWSSNGRTLLFNRSDNPSRKLDLWALTEPFGTPERRALLTTASLEGFAKFSPDDRWIAYSSDESGRSDVYVMSYPELKGKIPVSIDGGAYPIWSRDGRTLFYRRGSAVMSVSVSANGGFHAQKPQLLFDGPYVGQGGDTTFDIGLDGRFLLVRGDDAAMGRQLDVVSNWFDELKARVQPR
jgi:Tol biopolymer transport system component